MRCMAALPETSFELHSNNPVEKLFWGQLPLRAATAQFYFTKESLMQHLMHQFKYKGNKELGLQLGRILGEHLKLSNRFKADVMVPLPLFPIKEKRRGYNQSTLLCRGIQEVIDIPILEKVILRPQQTETQTKKGRIERWKNMEGKFLLADSAPLQDKHILLVDDVVTTGATLIACGQEILKAKNSTLSLATLCISFR